MNFGISSLWLQSVECGRESNVPVMLVMSQAVVYFFYLFKFSIVKINFFSKCKSAWRVLVGVMYFKVPTIAALHTGAIMGW
jgi:hypothetical protein